MDNKTREEFEQSLKAGFLDSSILSNSEFLPELLVNNKEQNKKVLTTIAKELERCHEFLISVAFVTTSGVATLINYFSILESKGIKGKILVSQYLNFTQPEALRRLRQFDNIELKIATSGNFHSKGYLFQTGGYYNLIIGSSNLTATALCSNKEWNLKVSATNDSKIVERTIEEFNNEFNKAEVVTEEFIARYDLIYQKVREAKRTRQIEIGETEEIKITPNAMQKVALENIWDLRNDQKNKALLISATGTGKTYLSAFDAQAFDPPKLLFVVHRLNIAKAAMKTFQSVFGAAKSMGIYSGSQKELDKDFLFSTVQTISKEEHLNKFSKDYFDYIIIDESHRSGASSYLRLLDYFAPKFLLGMTATPERTDGNDIFKLFDYNIAYEIRLNQAMEEDMLSPFHYYGVTDISVDGILLEEDSEFSLLAADERIDRIIEKAKFYGCDNGIIRGLVFCSKKIECVELSQKLNARGYKTIALTGDSSEEERSAAIDRLESDDIHEKLDYIFTVDIFNEGIDIPKVNQVIMLRPTQSAIIFVQQLGRGLRKADRKDYLTVIDFIGNYKNSYLIPVALYGDTSYNKDSLRKLMSSGNSMIPGTSTINFDEITKERIFQSINSANMQLLTDLRKDYNLLKFKLGRIPMMMDFIEHGSRDPFLYVHRFNSYFNFIKREEKNFEGELNGNQIELLEFFSSDINNAKRIEETIILNELLQSGELGLDEFRNLILEKYDYIVSDETIQSCIINLNFKFIGKEKKLFFLQEKIYFTSEFKKILEKKVFKQFLKDSIAYAIHKFDTTYLKENYIGGFILYNKYTRKDVCRILNWDKNYESTVYGYKIYKSSAPLFVTYKKAEDIASTIQYNDHFIDRHEFAWESKSNRKISSEEIQKLINSKSLGLRTLLFIQKSNNEGRDFYFMGDVTVISSSIKQGVKLNAKGKEIPVVHFHYSMNTPVDNKIYDYICDSKFNSELHSSSEPLIPKNDSHSENEKIINSPFKILSLNQVKPFENSIPFYDLYAAAGNFSELQANPDKEWIEFPMDKPQKDLFAIKVIGESMNKIIPNNSICLFKRYSGGSRNGEIVLVQNYNRQDPDFSSSYTVKKYTSSKVVEEGNWKHNTIVLKPYSFDLSYEDLVLQEDDIEALEVIGIFVRVLN